MFTRFGLVACVAAAALVVPVVAGASNSSSGSRDGGSALYQYAKGGPADSGSAASQYTEDEPTSAGGKAVGSKRTTTTKLPAWVQKSLSSADPKTRDRLTKLFKSTGSEAPKGRVTLGELPKDQSKSSVFHSLTAVFSSGVGSMARLAVLLAAVIGVSVAIGVTAVRKQRV